MAGGVLPRVDEYARLREVAEQVGSELRKARAAASGQLVSYDADMVDAIYELLHRDVIQPGTGLRNA